MFVLAFRLLGVPTFKVVNKERDEVFPEVTPMSVYERKDFRVKSAFDVRRPRSFPSHQAGYGLDGVRGLVESRRKSLNECLPAGRQAMRALKGILRPFLENEVN